LGRNPHTWRSQLYPVLVDESVEENTVCFSYRLREENGVNACDLGLDNGFSDIIPKFFLCNERKK
jgi:hypothetical protein